MPQPDPQRFVILAEGSFDLFDAKTGVSLLRYRGDEVVAVLDGRTAGRTVREVIGLDLAVPIVASLTEALPFAPTTLVIGIAPPGGQLPERWRVTLREAIAAGLDVVSGLHFFLGDDPELAALAQKAGVQILDLRRPPESHSVARKRAAQTRARRLLTVGTDCNVGKMVASLELTAAARAAGHDARFLATGQTGRLLAGDGFALDSVVSDFAAGVTEEQVIARGNCELLIIEGQGSLWHPGFSGVTAALVHGSLPDMMILCHRAGRSVMRSQEQSIPPLNAWIAAYEAFLKPLHPGRVIGVALNCHGLPDDEARQAIDAACDETGLPATDVIRFGVEPLLKAVRQSGLLASPGGVCAAVAPQPVRGPFV